MLKKMQALLLSLAMLIAVGSVAHGQAISTDGKVDFTLNVSKQLRLDVRGNDFTVDDWSLVETATGTPYLSGRVWAGNEQVAHLEILANRNNWTLTLGVTQTSQNKFFVDGGSLHITYYGATGNSLYIPNQRFVSEGTVKLLEASGPEGRGKKKYWAEYEFQAPLEAIQGGSTYSIALVYTLTADN